MSGLERAALIELDQLMAGKRSADDDAAIHDHDWPDKDFLTAPLTRRPMCGEDAVELCGDLIDLMSVLFSVSGRQLRSPKRHDRAVARVRQIGMYIAHVTLGLRMIDVAAGFGRDKSTVVHACHVIEDMRDDTDFDQIIAKAERIVRIAFRLCRSTKGAY